MPNARRVGRLRSFLRARLVFDAASSSADCDVRNLSADGAKILVDPTRFVPAAFALDIPTRGKARRARLIWRRGGDIGVAFLDRPGADLADRLSQLEEENAALRAKVLSLTIDLARRRELLEN